MDQVLQKQKIAAQEAQRPVGYHMVDKSSRAKKEDTLPMDKAAEKLAARFRPYVEREFGPLQEYVPEGYTTTITGAITYVIKIRISKGERVNLGVRVELDHGDASVMFCNKET